MPPTGYLSFIILSLDLKNIAVWLSWGPSWAQPSKRDFVVPLLVCCGVWHWDTSGALFTKLLTPKSCSWWWNSKKILTGPDCSGVMGCVVGLPRIELVCPVHPIGAPLDWDLGNLEARSTTSSSLPAKPHTRQAVKRCVFWCHFLMASVDFFQWFIGFSVGLGLAGWPLVHKGCLLPVYWYIIDKCYSIHLAVVLMLWLICVCLRLTKTLKLEQLVRWPGGTF